MKNIEKNSAAFIFSSYALITFIMAIFILLWDNKGAKSIWDKNTNDWLSLIWLLAISTLSFLSAKHSYFKKYLNNILLICLLAALIVNMAYVLSWNQEAPIFYYGAVHGIVLIGCGLWWHSSHEEKP